MVLRTTVLETTKRPIRRSALGTVAKDAETGEVLFEITEHGEEVILRKGGLGGREEILV